MKNNIICIPTKSSNTYKLGNELLFSSSGITHDEFVIGDSIYTPQYIYIIDKDGSINPTNVALLQWNDAAMEKVDENGYRVGEVLTIDENHIKLKNQFGNYSNCMKSEYPNAWWAKVVASNDPTLPVTQLTVNDINKLVKIYNNMDSKWLNGYWKFTSKIQNEILFYDI